MRTIVICLIVALGIYSSSYSQDPKNTDNNGFIEVFWDVKALKPNSELLDVKVIDKYGKHFDIKAIQNSEQTRLMDVKAFVNGKILDVKILVSDDKFNPVKAINKEGEILDIKAFTEEGEILPIKGVSQSGNIIHICAIDKENVFYDIIAISPSGNKNAIKGLKMYLSVIETNLYGVDIFAHIKSIPLTQ